MFHVGQKVVCVDDTGDRVGRTETFPVKGVVYTIRACGQYGVHLEEIINQPQQYIQDYGEVFFKARRFRPLIERKTDIGFAHEILRKATRKRSVDA